MHRALGELEVFMQADDAMPTVIKTAIIHAQFETIHPFLDGNGRTGRMLITFYLWKEGYLEKPVLFLSSYFKRHQKLYYAKLESYRYGKISLWVDFFLDGVIEIANEAIDTVGKITVLREKDMSKVQALGKRASDSAVRVLPRLYGQPIVNVATIKRDWLCQSSNGYQPLFQQGILRPKDKDKKYGQSYVYKEYLDIFTGRD
jgi:Fic family protein